MHLQLHSLHVTERCSKTILNDVTIMTVRHMALGYRLNAANPLISTLGTYSKFGKRR